MSFGYHRGGIFYHNFRSQIPANSITTVDRWLCPDLLTLDDIGAADNLRGRVVRAFFYVLRLWPPR